jgi:addiction module HigA family antidote
MESLTTTAGANLTAAQPAPGTLLRDHVLPALGLSVSQAARDLAISRQTLHRVLAGNAAITPEMAARLERFCGVPSRFWLHRQHERELRRAETALAAVLSRIPAHALPTETLMRIGADDAR